MHILITFFAAVAMMAPSAYSQVPFPGRCPLVTVKKPFDPTKYLGNWFEHKKYFAIFEAGGTCISANYTATTTPNTIGVENKQFSTLTGKNTSIVGTAVWLAPLTQEGKLGVSFPSAGGFQAPYWVLDTDYDNFSVVWACTDVLGLFNLQFAWILTRAQFPSAQIVTTAESVMTSNHVALDALTSTPQKNCDF